MQGHPKKIFYVTLFYYKQEKKSDLSDRQASLLYLSALHYISPQEIHPYS